MNVVFAILILLALFGLNAFLFTKNKHTPKPEGCENLTPDCSSCGMTECASRNKAMEKEENNGNH